MSAEIKHFSSFTVQGLQTRTTNAAEQTADAKIGPLWQRYFGTYGMPTSTVYGVYSSYESDWTGAFDVLTGCEVAGHAAPKAEQVVMQVQAGDYLVFPAKGEMPQAIIEAWGRVWRHFSHPHSDWQRCYVTDFEQYLGVDEAAICIGVKPV
jgi:predicted transcriptional regulator YdeE